MRACAGVGRSDVGTSRMWYRRNFTVPQDWGVAAGLQGSSAKRLLLHFGAVDWEAEVFVNRHRMGLHRGGCVDSISRSPLLFMLRICKTTHIPSKRFASLCLLRPMHDSFDWMLPRAQLQ